MLLIALGVGAVLVGALVWLGAFSWFGRLPGDIRIETENARIYIPLVSMLLLSIALTVIINLFTR